MRPAPSAPQRRRRAFAPRGHGWQPARRILPSTAPTFTARLLDRPFAWPPAKLRKKRARCPLAPYPVIYSFPGWTGRHSESILGKQAAILGRAVARRHDERISSVNPHEQWNLNPYSLPVSSERIPQL
jgi:hypothetical protein